ncbi:MAG TPA: phage holin family protein [Burkholderiales bacterium]|nr:phage holin family protein [Burkholderiales bacterium]
MSEEPGVEHPRAGLFESIKALLATTVSIAHTRLELFSTEIQEEIDRVVARLLWSLVALFFLALGVLLGAVAIIIAFWDSYRLGSAIVLSLSSLGIAVLLWLRLRTQAAAAPRLLEATLDELAKDEQRLRSAP